MNCFIIVIWLVGYNVNLSIVSFVIMKLNNVSISLLNLFVYENKGYYFEIMNIYVNCIYFDLVVFCIVKSI